MIKYTIDSDIELKILDNTHATEILYLINSSRSHLGYWLTWVDKTMTLKDVESFIESTKNQRACNNGFQSGIWYKGNLAGIIGFHRIDWVTRSTSIGYWLGKGYMGKGIMTKAVATYVEYALNCLNLNRVEIRCAEQNFKSRAIPERLGFITEGLVKDSGLINGRYVNHIVYGILPGEWNNPINKSRIRSLYYE